MYIIILLLLRCVRRRRATVYPGAPTNGSGPLPTACQRIRRGGAQHKNSTSAAAVVVSQPHTQTALAPPALVRRRRPPRANLFPVRFSYAVRRDFLPSSRQTVPHDVGNSIDLPTQTLQLLHYTRFRDHGFRRVPRLGRRLTNASRANTTRTAPAQPSVFAVRRRRDSSQVRFQVFNLFNFIIIISLSFDPCTWRVRCE